MKNMRERMERGEKVSALDLIATHESYFARDLDREEALREMEKLTEKLKRIRERHGDKRMIQTLTKRLYARRYNFRQNTMLGLFTGSERGNCQATAKAASTILEQVGLDPKTEIAHQMFSDHVRAVAKIEDRWHVLEGRARLLGSKETMGTVFVSLQDENRGLLGLAPESPIELGEASFHTQDGTVQNPGLAAWLKRGLSKADVWFGSRLRHKTPSIHHRSGERSASLIGMANIESLFGSLYPFTPRQTKLVASSIVALSFLYAGNRSRDPDMETMEDLSEAIHSDVDTVREMATTAVEAIADFAKRELEDVKASATLKPFPPGSRRKEKDKEERVSVQTVEGISTRQIDELGRRFAAYYGVAHFLFHGSENETSVTDTPDGFRMDVHTPPEATTIGRDLYRHLIIWGYGDIADGLPDHFVINFSGERLLADSRERTKLADVIAHIQEFRPGKDPNDPFHPYLVFQINGETIGSLGVPPSERQMRDHSTYLETRLNHARDAFNIFGGNGLLASDEVTFYQERFDMLSQSLHDNSASFDSITTLLENSETDMFHLARFRARLLGKQPTPQLQALFNELLQSEPGQLTQDELHTQELQEAVRVRTEEE